MEGASGESSVCLRLLCSIVGVYLQVRGVVGDAAILRGGGKVPKEPSISASWIVEETAR